MCNGKVFEVNAETCQPTASAGQRVDNQLQRLIDFRFEIHD
jgi:hypothetical protein